MTDDKNISILNKANSDVLNYFTNRHKECADSIEHHKTALFELNIKLDELNKTKSIYSLSTSSKKDLFKPIPKDKDADEKESRIENEIKSLLEEQRILSTKIMEETSNLKFISRKIKLLKAAELSIKELKEDIDDRDMDISSLEKENINLKNALSESRVSASTTSSSATYEEEKKKELEAFRKEVSEHGKKILMIDAFDKSYMSTMLDKKVKDKLSGAKSKLEAIRFLISSDPKRAKQSINEIISEIDLVNDDISFLLGRILYNIDTKKPLSDMLDSFVAEKSAAHPNCIIETDYSKMDSSAKTSYITGTSLIHLMNIFVENVYKHSNANRIIIKLSNEDGIMSAYIKDNGIGIADDYMEKSPWYSSIHKAVETIYLLNGNLSIEGSHENGTTVKFSFPM